MRRKLRIVLRTTAQRDMLADLQKENVELKKEVVLKHQVLKGQRGNARQACDTPSTKGTTGFLLKDMHSHNV